MKPQDLLDLLNVDLGIDVPYEPLKPFHPPKLPALAGNFTVVALTVIRTAGPRGCNKLYASKPETEHTYERR